MVTVMDRKALIAPVGTYEQRLWRAISKSGADSIYLITESKPEYEITKTIASNLETRIKENLFCKIERKDANFSSFQDIYRVFVGIIETERQIDPSVRITLDVTSTTKESALVAANLAGLYNLTISYVPGGAKKDSKEIIEQRYRLLKDDPGSDYKEVSLGRPGVWCKFSEEEQQLLYKIGEKKVFNSVSDLISSQLEVADLKNAESGDKKRLQRIVDDLEEKGIISCEEYGKNKSLKPTEAGEGIYLGLKEANEMLKAKGKQALV